MERSEFSTENFAIVVLHYGSLELTKRCLESLRNATCQGARVIVSCNCSGTEARAVCHMAEDVFGDKNVSMVPPQISCVSRLSSCVILANDSNKGFAAGNNAGGFVALRDPRVKWLWFLNNDTAVEPAGFDALLHAVNNVGDRNIIGATVVDMDRPESVQCAGGNVYNPMLTTTTPCCAGTHRDELPSSSEVELDYVFGASMCIPADVFRTLGGFCEKYFLYYEEIDFCRSAAALGISLVWEPDLIVRHQGAASTGRSGADREKRNFAHFHENYSTFIFTKRHHKKLLPIVLAVRILGKIPILIARGEGYLLKSLWQAVYCFLRDCLLNRI